MADVLLRAWSRSWLTLSPPPNASGCCGPPPNRECAPACEAEQRQLADALPGACGPVRRVGSRRDEAVLADRERRLAEMQRRERTAGVMRFERRR
jgi:hypothetical protein